MRKRYLIGTLILATLLGTLLGTLLAGCGRAPAPTVTPPAAAPARDSSHRSSSGGVTASGVVAPAQWALLGTPAGGRVVEVRVETGQEVIENQALVRLDTADLEIARTQAEQDLALQRALLDELLAGAGEQTVARAERENAYQVAQAALALQASEQELQQARARHPDQDVAAAQARVRQLDLQLARSRALDPEPEVTMAQVELERAKLALEETQDEYNKALDRPWEDQSVRDAWVKRLRQAELDHTLAQMQLERAQNAQRAHALGLAALAAQSEEAEIALAQAVDAREAYSITLKALDTGVQAAQARLDHLQSWENPYLDEPAEGQIAQARARLEQARLGLAQIERQIDAAQVRAPFAGTVSEVHARVGQVVLPGQHLVTLGNLSTIRAETTDLSERDVTRVAVGQAATVYVEALGAEIAGQVTGIALEATTVGGDTVYQVIVELDEPSPDIRWGMSVEVEIEARE